MPYTEVFPVLIECTLDTRLTVRLIFYATIIQNGIILSNLIDHKDGQHTQARRGIVLKSNFSQWLNSVIVTGKSSALCKIK